MPIITLHQARFSALQPRHADYQAVLSVDERERAARLRFDDARERYVLGRGWLRHILAERLQRPAAEIRFRYGERGKPGLDHDTPLTFNLAHSGDYLLLALAENVSLGVDIEAFRPQPHLRTMARDNFSTKEQAALFALPADEQLAAFYRIWTRKEAYIKATGDGFSLPLTDFDVTHTDPPQIERAGDRWRLLALDLPAGVIGAMCVGYRGALTIDEA